MDDMEAKGTNPDADHVPADWFEGAVDGGLDAETFLARVRELAPAALAGLVDPDDTDAIPYGCVLTVDVPGVPASEWPAYSHMLQVLYAPGLLGGYWGCSHLWDDCDPDDPEALHVTDDLTPEQAAERAVYWLAEQLRRPLVRQEWNARWYGVGLSRWVLTDTGRVVAGRHRPPRRRPEPTASWSCARERKRGAVAAVQQGTPSLWLHLSIAPARTPRGPGPP